LGYINLFEKKDTQKMTHGFEPLFLRNFTRDSVSTQGTQSADGSKVRNEKPLITCVDEIEQQEEVQPYYQNRFSVKKQINAIPKPPKNSDDSNLSHNNANQLKVKISKNKCSS
jgi:hypothetical protein